uniref:WGS project CBMI000000000 data, contig CS3069_c004454 n=1 Tax=Fusarium clavum TaxID=2594811 RepID=A0A090MEI2_9HYPO|nr:unnamed protein product [Fusarium clavum]
MPRQSQAHITAQEDISGASQISEWKRLPVPSRRKAYGLDSVRSCGSPNPSESLSLIWMRRTMCSATESEGENWAWAIVLRQLSMYGVCNGFARDCLVDWL